MTCKDCVHVGICNSDIWFTEKGVQIQDSEKVEEDCRNFKDKSRFIELPCNEGTKVWLLRKDRVPDDDYRMSFHDEWVLCEVSFQLSMINQIGKTVFLTRDEAEKALKEREKDNG